MKLLEKIDLLALYEAEGRSFLTLETGLTPKALASSNFAEIRKKPGFILKNGVLESFNFNSVEEVDGKVVLVNREIDWKISPLYEEDLDSLIKLNYFINILKANGIEIKHLSLNMFYKDGDGNPFILTPDIIDFINQKRTLTSSEELVLKYRDPRREEGDDSILYSLASLLYTIITKQYPYSYDSIEELRDNIRRNSYLKPDWLVPGLKKDVDTLITELLNNTSELSLQEFHDNLVIIKEDGWVDSLGDSKLKNLKEWGDKKVTAFRKRVNLRKSIIKNRGKILIGSVVFLFFGTFFGTIAYNKLKPPVTTGFTPRQIVDAFFVSIQTYNSELLDDVLKSGVASELSDELATVHVTSRIRPAYGGDTKSTMNPKEWLDLDDENKYDVFVYGIYNLEIEQLSELEFKVDYEKWVSQTDHDENPMGVQTIYKYITTEILVLEESKYSYVISDINRIKFTEEVRE